MLCFWRSLQACRPTREEAYERGVGWITAAPGPASAVRSAKQFLAEAGFEVFKPAGTYFITTDIRPLYAVRHDRVEHTWP